MSGPFGVFENLTVIFYLLALGYLVQALWGRRSTLFSRWRTHERKVLLLALALVLFGEEIQWGLPWLYPQEIALWPFYTIQGLLAQASAGVPPEASLKVIAAIAGIRLAAVLGVIYALMAAIYYRNNLSAGLSILQSPAARWIATFVIIFASAALMHSGVVPGAAIFEEALEAIAAGAFLGGVHFLYKDKKD